MVAAPLFLTTLAFSSAMGIGLEAEEAPTQITVVGQRVTKVHSATKTDTPLQDVPQAISVITGQQIDDQALRSVSDLLRYVPGAVTAQGEGHRDQIVLRGNNSTADFFVDGLRDDVQY